MITDKGSNHIKYLERAMRLDKEYPIMNEKATTLAT
jgi:hypothetical protein